MRLKAEVLKASPLERYEGLHVRCPSPEAEMSVGKILDARLR
jgi:hypothetical protein